MTQSSSAIRSETGPEQRVNGLVILGSGMSSIVKPWSPVEVVANELRSDPFDGRRLTICMPVVGITALVSIGRRHAYEGWSGDEVGGIVATATGCGARWMVVVNAAGGLSPKLREGAIMAIEDIVALPVRDRADRGRHRGALFAPHLHRRLEEQCVVRGIGLARGVYAYMPGPTYETRAEIRMVRHLGADAVGMSTFPETLAARRAGLPTLGLSLLTNVACEHPTVCLSHDDVIALAERGSDALRSVIEEAVAVLEATSKPLPPVAGGTD